MTTILSPNPVQKFFDNNGNPLNQGQLFSYEAGTAIPLSTYTDSTGSTPNPNPTILNARGEASVWIPPNVAYKFTLQDSLGNQIWSVDQIVNSQLLTLYGGVDTGSANAYVLSFVANFTSYTDGIFVIWVPANANTGASTININGLGPINLVNQNGTALAAGQITPNLIAQVLIKGGQALLLSGSSAGSVLAINGVATAPSISWANAPRSGLYLANATTGEIGVTYNSVRTGNFLAGQTVSLTVTGVTGVSSVSCPYTLNQNIATIQIPAFSGVGTGTSFALSGSVGNLSPAPGAAGSGQFFSLPAAQDNGSNVYSQVGVASTLGSPIPTSISITFYKNGVAAGWVATGSRGIGDANAVTQGWYVSISYPVSGTS